MRPGDSLSPFLWEYCLGLKDRGWDITVLVPHHTGLKLEENWENINIKRFKYLPERYENLAYSGGLMPGLRRSPLKGLKLPFYIYSMYSEALRIISSGGIDIVNFHWLFPACFWLRRFKAKTGIPIVLTGHGTDVRLAIAGLFRFFAHRSLAITSALTLNSDYMKGILKDLITHTTVEVIPMGVDTERFKPGIESPSKSKRILYIGRLIEQKGVGILLDAFCEVIKKIPEARLEIIGYGPQKEYLVDKIGDANLFNAVKISDPVGYDFLPEKYRSARVLALPSLIPEGLGMTAVEAGACGVPTVTFGLGGTSEYVINEDTGIIVDKNKKALAEGMIRILSDDALADRMGQNARQSTLERYLWPVISEKFDRLFRQLI